MRQLTYKAGRFGAHVDRYRALVSVQQAMQRLRAYRSRDAIERSRIDVPGMRVRPRARRECRSQCSGCRTGNVSPWRERKSHVSLGRCRVLLSEVGITYFQGSFREGSSQAHDVPVHCYGRKTPFSPARWRRMHELHAGALVTSLARVLHPVRQSEVTQSC